MLKLIVLVTVIIVKTILCKFIWLGSVLLLFWIKGKLIKFDSLEWDNFFLWLTPKKAQICAAVLYLLANLFTSVLSYFAFNFAGFRYGLFIAAIMFVIGILVSVYRWRKNHGMLFDKYHKMQKEIKEKGEKQNE